MKKIGRFAAIFLALVFLLLCVLGYITFQLPGFGRLPESARLEAIKKSPHYKDGAFQNLTETPSLTEGSSQIGILMERFANQEQTRPSDSVPSIKTDLLSLSPDQNVLVWFGHSSYFMQIDGKRILVDPVFSPTASPFSFIVKAFSGSNRYTAEDIPPIDYVFITHDHWDHLSYETMLQLKPKVGKIITGLGTGAHLEYWGFDKGMVIEGDWNEKISLGEDSFVQLVPAQHFSGRGLKRNQSLWTAFALKTPTLKILMGGDSGYGEHFSGIRDALGNFDLVILENGQYDKNWKYIHMTPDQVLQATRDLGATRVFPVHSGKFALARHRWDEPLEQITQLSDGTGITLVTPMIGEVVYLNDETQSFRQWWREIN